MNSMDGDEDLSFLAYPGAVTDWRMVALYGAAVDAGVLGALPGTAEEIAAQLGLQPMPVRVVLDALSTWSLTDCDGAGRYTIGPKAYDTGAAATLWLHARALRSWTRLDEAVRDPLSKRYRDDGTPPDTFQLALAAIARRRAPALADAILSRLRPVSRMLDLGGGHGEYALEFARRGIAATLLDRPAVIDAARRRGAVASGGVEMVAGDFFEMLPAATYDLVLVAGVTHTFDAAHNRRIFERIRTILSSEGAIGIVTMLRDQHAVARLFAVQMLCDGGGADTHSEDDYRQWLRDTGYRVLDVFSVADSQAQGVILATPE